MTEWKFVWGALLLLAAAAHAQDIANHDASVDDGGEIGAKPSLQEGNERMGMLLVTLFPILWATFMLFR